jgi:hypothetical protein
MEPKLKYQGSDNVLFGLDYPTPQSAVIDEFGGTVE